VKHKDRIKQRKKKENLERKRCEERERSIFIAGKIIQNFAATKILIDCQLVLLTKLGWTETKVY